MLPCENVSYVLSRNVYVYTLVAVHLVLVQNGGIMVLLSDAKIKHILQNLKQVIFRETQPWDQCPVSSLLLQNPGRYIVPYVTRHEQAMRFLRSGCSIAMITIHAISFFAGTIVT